MGTFSLGESQMLQEAETRESHMAIKTGVSAKPTKKARGRRKRQPISDGGGNYLDQQVRRLAALEM